MTKESYSKMVAELQAEFLRRLSLRDETVKANTSSLLLRLLKSDDEIVEISLGNVGHRLKKLAHELDFSHPEVGNLFNGILSDGQLFSQDCIELLSLAEIAKERQFHRIMPMLGKTSKEVLTDSVLTQISRPQSHVRLLKDSTERIEMRLLKKTQNIDLSGVYAKGDDVWRMQPDNFKQFLRYDTSYLVEIELAEKKAKRYADLGCKSLSEEITRTVEEYKKNVEDSYYGFNRIKMVNAAVILAKSLGFTYNRPASYNLFTIDETVGKIAIDGNYFDKYNFDPDYTPTTPEVPSFFDPVRHPFLYEPRVYPLPQMWDIAPKNVVDTIGVLDAFPDAGGKPIFDHYGVIVPSFAFFHERLSFLDENGVKQTFLTRDRAVKALDSTLVRGGHLPAVVVGDRDGKCYFICFFQ